MIYGKRHAGPTSNFPTGNTEPEDGLASRLRSTPDRQDRGAHQYQETNSSLGKHPRDAESVGVDHQIRPTKKLIQKLNENSSQFQYRLSVGDEEYVIRKAEKRYQGYANWTKVLSRHAEEFPPRDEEITQSAKQTIEDHIENFPVSFFHDERLPGRYGTTSLVEFHLPPIIFAWISHAPEYERKDYLERNQNMWTFKRNLRRKIRPIFRSLNIIHNMAASNGLHHEIPQLTQDTHKELLTWFHDLIFAENGSLSKKRSDNPKGGKTVDQARLYLSNGITSSERIKEATTVPMAIVLIAYYYKGSIEDLDGLPSRDIEFYLKSILEALRGRYSPIKKVQSPVA
ncbi:hypothetical protein Pst134EA_011612 [Puccinia striiformis f. sp. tritici]|uniref:hypothetical protein n=1 Tax=Puccinia striiformis f. sp. tritici TaxID=168172 RepID=UPI002007CBB9|nr:hypothetical protein Pst134EA_011612 [Puccinia striiformis f. sp. tritici]KAH9467990.1 hypothetical protein Pst134EA_011612 [Puccinia striiformis f. sp. tritici]